MTEWHLLTHQCWVGEHTMCPNPDDCGCGHHLAEEELRGVNGVDNPELVTESEVESWEGRVL